MGGTVGSAAGGGQEMGRPAAPHHRGGEGAAEGGKGRLRGRRILNTHPPGCSAGAASSASTPSTVMCGDSKPHCASHSTMSPVFGGGGRT